MDEILSPFGERCPFKICTKDKLGKYYILIRILTDSETRCIVNMNVYCGWKDIITGNIKSSTEIVTRLEKSLEKSSENDTTNQYYTSLDLAENSYSRFGLTTVGTLRTNSLLYE